MLTFDPWNMLLLGLATGLAFGFLLQRGGVTKYPIIVGQFLWANHTVLRTMLTAIVVGSAGVLAMHQLWDIKLHVKEATLWGNILGGGIFGIGMALLGYCPGTGIGAIADGSRHAIWGVLACSWAQLATPRWKRGSERMSFQHGPWARRPSPRRSTSVHGSL